MTTEHDNPASQEAEEINQAPATDFSNELSDDELMNMSDEDLENLMAGDNETKDESEESEEEEVPEDSDPKDQESEEDEGSEQEEEESDEDELEEESEDSDDEAESEDDDSETGSKEKSPLSEDVQGKLKAYEMLMGKFTANGQEVQVESPEDALKLMQMGAGFHKKMAQLKPVRKIAKMLENHSLLDENKLSFLIDLSKGDKTAIHKLLKDNDIDPLSFDVESDTGYESKSYTVSDSTIELSDALKGIQDTESGKRLIDDVSNKWDDNSREAMAKTPEMFGVINQHIQAGVYDKIMAKVELDRALGKLNGLSTLEAYHKTGEAMYANQGNEEQSKAETPKPKANAQSKTSSDADKSKLSDKKRAATLKKKKPASTPTIEDLGNMSDDDFEEEFGNINFV